MGYEVVERNCKVIYFPSSHAQDLRSLTRDRNPSPAWKVDSIYWTTRKSPKTFGSFSQVTEPSLIYQGLLSVSKTPSYEKDEK